MRVMLDDTPLEVARPTLACAIETGIEQARSAGRIVIEIALDGEALTDEQLGSPSEEEMPGAEVALKTAEPIALVRTTLMESRDALADAIHMQKQAAAMIHAGQAREAMDSLGEALGLWQAVQQVVQQTTTMVNISPENLTLERAPDVRGAEEAEEAEEAERAPSASAGTGAKRGANAAAAGAAGAEPPISLAMRIDELASSLMEVRESMRAGDLSRLADALEYDLVEKAELWRTLLDNFSAALRDE